MRRRIAGLVVTLMVAALGPSLRDDPRPARRELLRIEADLRRQAQTVALRHVQAAIPHGGHQRGVEVGQHAAVADAATGKLPQQVF